MHAMSQVCIHTILVIAETLLSKILLDTILLIEAADKSTA